MLIVSTENLFFASILCGCVGFTLLKYSKDGDIKLRNNASIFADSSQTNENQAWERLNDLAVSTDVSWNTSLFVAIVSSFFTLSLISYSRAMKDMNANTTGMLWLISIASVFFLQDLVIRWKTAHRKQAVIKEQMSIMERLRWKNFVYK